MDTRALLFLVAFLSPLPASQSALAGTITSDLDKARRSVSPATPIPVIVKFRGSAVRDAQNLAGDRVRRLDRHSRRLLRARYLRMRKNSSLANYRALRTAMLRRKGSRFRHLWIANAMALTVPNSAIGQLAAHPRVASVQIDTQVFGPVTNTGQTAPLEWNLLAVTANRLWDAGHLGKGIVVASMDTGVDVNHPDLSNAWRGGSNSWFDPYGEHASPFDADGHGTQAAGIIVGGAAGGSAIGVAPEAQWIAAKIFDDSGNGTVSAIHLAFQWLLDPDGNPSTDDVPDIVNNSWGLINTVGTCDTEFQADIQALKDAGILVTFAAGNFGPNPGTDLAPANSTDSVSIGAVDDTLTVASFSSRGPSACDGGIFPKLTAPGVNIRTSDLTFGGLIPNSYTVVNGTSFAVSHTSGVMALLLGAEPRTGVQQIETVLEQGAFDVSGTGPGNDYGAGVVDASESFSLLLLYAGNTGIVPLVDLNGNSTAELSLLRRDSQTGGYTLQVRDIATNKKLNQFGFDAAFTPKFVTKVANADGAGATGMVVLGVDGLGKVRAQIKNVNNGSLVSKVGFDSAYRPQSMEVIPDVTGNGIPELGVLGINTAGEVQVQIKDAFTAALVNRVMFSSVYEPQALVAIPDSSGNGAPELALLGVNATGKVRVEIKDVSTGASVNTILFDRDYVPHTIVAVPDVDNNGVDELAVLGVDQGGAVQVQIKDAATDGLVNKLVFDKTYIPQAMVMVPDVDGNGVAELAVLGVNSAGSVRAQTRDVSTASLISKVPFDQDFAPQKLEVIADVDGAGNRALAVLGLDANASVRGLVKNVNTGGLVNNVYFPVNY